MDAFVEFTCPKDAYRCVTRKRGKILGSRHVLLDVVNQEELMKELFPRARGIAWEGVIPNVLSSEGGNSKADLVTKEELVLVVGHARTPHRVWHPPYWLFFPSLLTYDRALSVESAFRGHMNRFCQ